ncbi:hypothetical protein [Laribacter hongkongensis]|uniref:hypothetical protein n=1 Tax=Laribacter hongkongensis TaxID=168471 RepID=UPI001EFED9DD|nr:hypothetical protein [Laribacter hongkongensis]MCG9079450.1 hypothetical protein [Laribacter hongkongensis]
MNAKVDIDGPVNTAINAETGATVHIHVGAVPVENRSEQEINRAVSTLLRTCQDAGCKLVVERISALLFGSSMFKTLSMEQLQKLQRIAEELVAQTEVAQTQIDDVMARIELAGQTNNDLHAVTEKLQAKLNAQHIELERLRQAKPPRPLCQTCSTATAKLARAHRHLVVSVSMIITTALAAAYLGHHAYAATESARLAESRLTVCEFEDKAFGLGSVLERNGLPDMRCVERNDGGVGWEEIKRRIKR